MSDKGDRTNFDSSEFIANYSYQGDDLGVTYSTQATTLKVWAPTANKVCVKLYDRGDGGTCLKVVEMKQEAKGIWLVELSGDYEGIYYTYVVDVNGQEEEAVDLYATATGVNGERGMILDRKKTNPEGFDQEVRPTFQHATDAIIYELHIRDFSSSKDSGSSYPGKYLAFTEEHTKNQEGFATLMDYVKQLGVTHIHLLPTFDYASVDESKDLTQQFNWGYDPKNYNVPEGSYATNPYDGAVRMKEMKQMVQAIHKNGLRVIMDVVYNHTYSTVDSNYNKLVPDYYYRKEGERFSDASDCGNEVASERVMVRKYMVDSVVYWAKEYHIDGFRFDLMGIHDIETMNAIRAALNEVDPSILVYGEGWTGGPSTLPESLRAMKCNMAQMPGVGAFCDDIRDGIKGSVFEADEKGYVNGASGLVESIKFGIVAATQHPQVDYGNVNYSKKAWANTPDQCINYTSAHDNYTLWDKLCTTNPEDSYEDRVAMNKLSAAIVMTSQGIPFFQAGEEMLRTKPSLKNPGQFDENSYCSPDATNSIKWESLSKVQEVIEYYKGLMEFRKAHPALRFHTTDEIQKNLRFMSGLEENVIAYTIEEDTNKLCIIYNPNNTKVDIPLPDKNWDVYVNEKGAGTNVLRTITSNCVTVSKRSALVMIQKEHA